MPLRLSELHAELSQIEITDRLEQTFGPNECTALKMQHLETGEILEMICNRKHCNDCGPRKAMLNDLQAREAFSDIVWISRTTKDEIHRALEAAKKRKQRNGEQFTYLVVGDERNGYIFVSDQQLSPYQRRMSLADWRTRISHAYRYGGRRRCSRRLSSMSLLRKRKKSTNEGHSAPTYQRYIDGGGSQWLAAVGQIHEEHVQRREEYALAWDKTLTFARRDPSMTPMRESEQLVW